MKIVYSLISKNTCLLLITGIVTLMVGCSSEEPPARIENVSEAPAEAQAGPDYVFINGKVLTVDENFSVVEAVAVAGNKIQAVGSSQDMQALAADNTEIIDLKGKTVTPGIIDVHNHLIYNAPIWPNNTRLEKARTRV